MRPIEKPQPKVACLMCHPDVGDGQHWSMERVGEVDPKDLGERILEWARSNPDSQIVIRTRPVDAERYENARSM